MKPETKSAGGIASGAFYACQIPAKPNTTPTTADRAMNTMGCQSFTGLTQLVSTSSTAARSSHRRFRILPPAVWKLFNRAPSPEVTRMQVSTSKMTDTQAAPIKPVEAGRRP